MTENARGLLSKLNREELDREEVERQLADRDKIIAKLRSENSELKQNSTPGVEFPEADKLLNQLKARRKKSTASLADVESILEILEES